MATKDHCLFLALDRPADRPIFRGFASAARFASETEASSRRDAVQGQFEVPSTYPLAVVMISEIEQEIADRGALLELSRVAVEQWSGEVGNRYVTELAELMVMVEDVRDIRVRICDPDVGLNPRYMALSNVIAYLNEVIDDVQTGS